MKANGHLSREDGGHIHSIQSELEETLKHQVEDVLSCVDLKTLGLHKELTEKTDKTQVDLQAVKTRVEAGSNTSTVTLRVVRGDKMGLKKAAP
jgi:hypothetical protein